MVMSLQSVQRLERPGACLDSIFEAEGSIHRRSGCRSLVMDGFLCCAYMWNVYTYYLSFLVQLLDVGIRESLQ